MEDSQRKKELRQRISKTSKDQVILEEMKKLGYWPNDSEKPSLPEQFLEKESKLNQELRELYIQKSRIQDKEKFLAMLRKERMQASKEKQKENKLKRQQERESKAEAWKLKKENEIHYLGEDVSNNLSQTETNEEQLKSFNLPIIKGENDLANLLGVSVSKLRFLTYNRNVAKVNHYRHFEIKKKTGGKRRISAPMPQLKEAQHRLLHEILYKIPLHDAAKGFRVDHSIVSNAKPHIAKDTVINLDLQNFFPTIEYPRVLGVFKSFGYNGKIATLMALICTQSPVEKVSMDGTIYYIKTGARHLPQGAPTSPAITNIICRKLDARLNGLAKKYGYEYSRYADDMTFSCLKEHTSSLSKLMGNVRRIIKDEGFNIHPDKTRVMRKGAQQEVTGVVVNEKLNVSKKKIDKFRSLLFQIEKDGSLEGKHWNRSENLLAAIRGYANYIHQVNPEKGAPLVARAEAILKKHHFKHEIKHPKKVPVATSKTSNTKKEKAPWWKFW